MTKTIDVHDAQTQFLELWSLVRDGNEVIITHGQQPIMRLVPINAASQPRVAGLHAGLGWISDDFDAPLADEFWLGEE